MIVDGDFRNMYGFHRVSPALRSQMPAIVCVPGGAVPGGGPVGFCFCGDASARCISSPCAR